MLSDRADDWRFVVISPGSISPIRFPRFPVPVYLGLCRVSGSRATTIFLEIWEHIRVFILWFFVRFPRIPISYPLSSLARIDFGRVVSRRSIGRSLLSDKITRRVVEASNCGLVPFPTRDSRQDRRACLGIEPGKAPPLRNRRRRIQQERPSKAIKLSRTVNQSVGHCSHGSPSG